MKKFLEEQASEREAEIDEATKKINTMESQLRDLERTKERDQRMTSEVCKLNYFEVFVLLKFNLKIYFYKLYIL